MLTRQHEYTMCYRKTCNRQFNKENVEGVYTGLLLLLLLAPCESWVVLDTDDKLC